MSLSSPRFPSSAFGALPTKLECGLTLPAGVLARHINPILSSWHLRAFGALNSEARLCDFHFKFEPESFHLPELSTLEDAPAGVIAPLFHSQRSLQLLCARGSLATDHPAESVLYSTQYSSSLSILTTPQLSNFAFHGLSSSSPIISNLPHID